MEKQFNSVEKVLWKATYEFHLSNGSSEVYAREMATNKVIQKRSLAIELKKQGITY